MGIVLTWKTWGSIKSRVWKTGAGQKTSKHQAPHQGDKTSESKPETEEVNDEEEFEEPEYKIGEILQLSVDDLHFGLPRCRVRVKDLEPMPTMIKWAPEEFENVNIDVARVHMGTFGFWVVQGMRSNRILYAMKKHEVVSVAHCTVVEPPPPRQTEEDEDNFQDSYGTELGKIQLIP